MSRNKSKVELGGEDALQPTLPLKGKQAEVLPFPYNTVITPSQIRDVMLPPPQLSNCVTKPEMKVFPSFTQNQTKLMLPSPPPPKRVREQETKKKKIFKLAGDNGITERSSLGEKLRSRSRKKMRWMSCSRTLEKINSRTMRFSGTGKASPAPGLAGEMVEGDLRQSKDISHSLRSNDAMDDAILAKSDLVDAYMKRSEMHNTLLDLKDKLTRFRNSNDDLRKKINDLRA
ncbi:hypothetical protein QYE76_041807 [Lolium multiflorum]|uniref:Uncharacterized protein n=1 Tax=Lolium multiflorum TaxID=4521 RepID=A0AAD8WUH4_LOLMU|nr:hypothetical protein QYE76_041807 [Lolium multiflorum]